MVSEEVGKRIGFKRSFGNRTNRIFLFKMWAKTFFKFPRPCNWAFGNIRLPWKDKGKLWGGALWWDRLWFSWGATCTSCRSAWQTFGNVHLAFGREGSSAPEVTSLEVDRCYHRSQYDSWWSEVILSSLPCLSYEILAEYDDSSVSPWPEKCADTKVKNFVDLSLTFLGTKRKKNGRKNLVKCYAKGTKSGKDDIAVENNLGDFSGGPVVKTLSCQCRGYRFNTSKISHAVWCGQEKKGREVGVMRVV